MDTKTSAAPNDTRSPGSGWWALLDHYQKYVFLMGSLAWMFDCLGQQVFIIARNFAMARLLPPGSPPELLKAWAGTTTTIFVVGWATGGLIFGSLGDRFGRARCLAVSILLYGVCTGLSGLAANMTDFCVYRLITGIGVGGVFGLAVALCADSLPEAARPHALGLLQALSAVGNMIAGAMGVVLGYWEMAGRANNGWRILFFVGALPAIVCVPLQFRMTEPRKWLEARAAGKASGVRFGSYLSLLGEARWRKAALFGMLLCVAGVVGLWGIGFFSPELVNYVIGKALAAQHVPAGEIPGRKLMWIGGTMIIQNFGSFLGMLAFTRLTQRHGRKRMFGLAAICAYISTVVTFKYLAEPWELFVLIPIMGFFQLALFAGFAIYLPELFPLRLRSTGTSFCYNVGRFVAASGPFTLGLLQASLAHNAPTNELKMEAFRNACCWVSSIYLLALLALPFLPETRGRPLPE